MTVTWKRRKNQKCFFHADTGTPTSFTSDIKRIYTN